MQVSYLLLNEIKQLIFKDVGLKGAEILLLSFFSNQQTGKYPSNAG